MLEEDLEIAPDFFDYFGATAPLLDDPAENLLGVSAWNDNGQEGHIKDPTKLYRSDFFPVRLWLQPERPTISSHLSHSHMRARMRPSTTRPVRVWAG